MWLALPMFYSTHLYDSREYYDARFQTQPRSRDTKKPVFANRAYLTTFTMHTNQVCAQYAISRDLVQKKTRLVKYRRLKSNFFYSMVYVLSTALLLLYDVTNKTSFDNIRAWLGEIREYAQDDVVIMLLGNNYYFYNMYDLGFENCQCLVLC